jgi:hypothetical protein
MILSLGVLGLGVKVLWGGFNFFKRIFLTLLIGLNSLTAGHTARLPHVDVELVFRFRWN